jgi:ligand-binding sensor domain-containing protein
MKRFFTVLFIFFVSVSFSQGNPLWRSFFSYNNIVDISQSGNRVYAAADYAMFSKSVLTNELKTITSVDGFKAELITAVHHSTAFNRTLVGNSNGLLLIVNADNTVVSRVDIIEEVTVQPNKKKINDIYEYDGKAYIATDFGIAVFDIAAMEFGDTYYLGPNGAEIAVVQSAVLNGVIYAATTNNGIRKAALNNPNLNDYNQWTEEQQGNWAGIMAYGGNLYAATLGGALFRKQVGYYQQFTTLPSVIVDMQEAGGFMVLTSKERVVVFNEQLAEAAQINVIPIALQPVTFSCASVVAGQLFIGTHEEGLFSTIISNLGQFSNITPSGPLRSNIFSLEKSRTALWAVYGDFTFDFNPDPLDYYGISKFTAEGWSSISNADLFGAASISDIIVHPANENLVYAASYHNGLIKIENDIPVAQYDDDPAIQNGPQSLNAGNTSYRSVRINGLAFDSNNNLWMTNALIEKPLKVLRADGQWASYSFKDVVNEPLSENYAKMVIDKNGTKWIPSLSNGLIAFNENLNNKFVVIKGEEGNIPSPFVRCLAIDTRSQLWIGTDKGLRVLRGVDRFLTEDELTASAIIILDDGAASELMYEQNITDIAVDGANNKWIATAEAGAFLVSPDGQQTLFHFTKTNSPLPSNIINDIAIDAATGEVFFATDKGMVSYMGTSTEASGNLDKVYVYPNPVRPGFEGDVNISGLIDQANVKITDIEGNLVYETTSEGGTILWDTRAFGRHKVASGVYMIFIASKDGAETKVKKVMIVR